jgi:hypothetical protein
MQTSLIFNLQPGTDRSSTHRNLTPGASNPRASRQLGVWGRCKTEREDREDRDGVLTSGGGRRHRPDFAGQPSAAPAVLRLGLLRVVAARGQHRAQEAARSRG